MSTSRCRYATNTISSSDRSFTGHDLYQDPLLSGEDYMTLHRTVGINLLGYSTLPQEDFHSVYGLYNPDSGHRLTDDIEILNNTKRRPAHCRGVFLCAICACIGEILFLQ